MVSPRPDSRALHHHHERGHQCLLRACGRHRRGSLWPPSQKPKPPLPPRLLSDPVARMPAHYTITMNEGINAYYEHVAGTGGKVYGHPPKYEYANCPPVFFHLIGWLGSPTGDINVTGRWVSLLACFAIAVFASLIVHRLGNSRRLGAYAGLCWLIW